MEFKKLELHNDKNWFIRKWQTPHFRKSLIYVLLGAIAGGLFYYFTEGSQMESLHFDEILKNAGLGAFFGFFITNSPCARGKC